MADERHKTIDRQQEILNLIASKGRIHHNALKKILVTERRWMATRTFDLNIKRLLEEKKILSQVDGNKKYYSIYKPILNKVEMKKVIEASINLATLDIDMLEKTYARMSIEQRITALTIYYEELLGNIANTAFCSTVAPSIEERTSALVTLGQFQMLLQRLSNVAMSDPNQEKIAPLLFSKLLSIGPNRRTQFLKLAKNLNLDLDPK